MSEETPINRIRRRIERFKRNNQWDRVAEEYQHMISFMPADADLYIQAGDASVKANRNTSAITWYLSAAHTYEADNDLEKTIAVLRKILKIKPSLMDIKVRMADLLARQGKSQLASEQFEEAYTYFLERNEVEEAITVYKRIVEMQPRNLIMHRKLADMYAERKMFSQALTEYRNLLQKVRELGLGNETLNVLQRIVDLDPKSSPETLELVRLYFKTEQYDLAHEQLQCFLGQNPTYGEGYVLLGDILLEMGRKREAIAAYEQYLVSNRKDIKIRRKTVALQIEEGELDTAIEGAWLLVDNFFKRGYLASAQESLAPFRGLWSDDVTYHELYVKLLGILSMKDDFEVALGHLITLLEQEGQHERVELLKQLRNEENHLQKISQYLTGRGFASHDGPGEDAIDELGTSLDGENNSPTPSDGTVSNTTGK